MELTLDPGRQREFEDAMSSLAPWMHGFKFGDCIYTGYYKYEGLGEALTFVNSSSDARDIERMRDAYARRDTHAWPEFVESLFDSVAPRAARRSMRVLDLASATGQLSLRAVDAGFGAVRSSEIRAEQCAQQRLILECLHDPRYRRAITVVHDPESADAATFPERYREFAPDVVLSFGLMYHLVNPLQHLVNLRNITSRHAILYTMTHLSPFARSSWQLTVENRNWITKATSGVSWVPHFLEVVRLATEVGFRRVTIHYPEMFRRHFPDFDRYTRATDFKLLADRVLQRAFRVRIGAARNQRFEYFQYAYVNPNYFAYVLEK